MSGMASRMASFSDRLQCRSCSCRLAWFRVSVIIRSATWRLKAVASSSTAVMAHTEVASWEKAGAGRAPCRSASNRPSPERTTSTAMPTAARQSTNSPASTTTRNIPA